MMPPLLSPPPLGSAPPPVLVGALGPRMVAMTAAVADGVVLHPMTSEPFLADLVDRRIPEALADAGRERSGFEVVAGALVGVHGDEDREDVRSMLRGMVAFYGSTPAYRPVLDSIGAGDLQPDLQALVRDGRWGELAAVVPDDVLAQLTVTGPPAEVAARLRQLYGARVDRLSLTFVQPLPPDGLGEVIDAFRVTVDGVQRWPTWPMTSASC